MLYTLDNYDTKRFWSKVDKDGPLPISNPEFGNCWIWTRGTNSGGYGSFKLNRKLVGSHKLALGLVTKSAIDINVLHTCDVHRCVRNDEIGLYIVDGQAFVRFGHLFYGNHGINNKDKAEKLRSIYGTNHWSSKLTEDDIVKIYYLRSKGLLVKDIAEFFGVGASLVSGILLGRYWKHIRKKIDRL